MIQKFFRLMVYAGAFSAPRSRAIGLICLILPALAILAGSRSAQAQAGYCIQQVGQNERGTLIRVEDTGSCNLYMAVRRQPHAGKDGAAMSRQEQLRSIWAANLASKADGSYEERAVRRHCIEAAGPEPGSDQDEIKRCGSKHTMYYYAQPNAVFLIPKERAMTPFDLAEQKKADAAAQERKAKEAADAAVRAREESEAFKRVREMEKRVAEAEAKVADADARLAWVSEKEWRANALPSIFALTVLAAAWAVLMTLAVSAYRFKYRSVTVDNYGYANPLEAAKDLTMKLASAREETARAKAEAETARSRDAERIRKLEGDLAGCQTELRAALTLNASVRKENEQHKRTIEVMAATPKSTVPTPREQAADVLTERCADLDAKYRELEEKHQILNVEHMALKISYGEKEEELATVYQVRDRQARMLMSASADKIQKDEQIEALEHENANLRQEYGRAQATLAEYEASWSSVLRASNRPPAISPEYPAATTDDVPTKVRRQTLPAGAAPAARSAESPTVTFSDAEPEELFAGLFQELADTKRERNIFRDGLQQIANLQSWASARMDGDAQQLERQVELVVADVARVYRTGVDERAPGESAAPASGPLPTATQSDIVRIARVASLLEGETLDTAALRALLGDTDRPTILECLKACVHEWAARSEAEAMVYAVFEPHELFDLNMFVSSRLVCGPDISLMVPEGYTDTVDRVHLAYAPAFSRGAVRRSILPPAAPQAAGQ